MFFLILFISSFSIAYPPHIVVSFSILEDITKNIMPADFKITSLIKPGMDSHGYSPNAKDYLTLKKSNHIVLIGAQFEPWATRALKKIKASAKIYYVTKKLTLLPFDPDHIQHRHHHDDDSNWDPHLWQSPETIMAGIQNLSLYFQGHYPSSKDEIQKLTAAYLLKLKSLQSHFKKEFLSIPENKRKIVISHNSLQYFAQEFGVEVISPLDAAHSGESSVKNISHVIQKIKKEKIKSLFLEKSSSPQLLESISKETNVPISGTLYTDCLSEESQASTYLKLLDYNFTLILKSMKGVAQ